MTMTETLLQVEEAVLREEQRADAAGADDADDRRGADVQLEGVQREGHVVGQHLRQDRPAHRLGAVAPPAAAASIGPVVDAVDGLGQQLGDDADVEEDERHDAGQRADADGGHEDERVQEVGDGAHDAQDAAVDASASSRPGAVTREATKATGQRRRRSRRRRPRPPSGTSR